MPLQLRTIVFNRNLTLYPLLIIFGLFLLYDYSFTVFHFFAEFFSIFIGFLIFTVSRTVGQFSHHRKNGLLLQLIASGYVWVAVMDLCHAITFPGMSFFIPGDANMTTQFWIAGRYIEVLTLVAFFSFQRRSFHPKIPFLASSLLGMVAILLIYYGAFPQTFEQGQGLTLFKMMSEMAVIVILCAILFILPKDIPSLTKFQLQMVKVSIGLTIISETFFMLYIDVDDLYVAVGHIFKVMSFWLIYLALTENVLKMAQDQVRTLLQTLEVNDSGLAILEANAEIEYANNRLGQMFGYAPNQMVGKPATDFMDHLDLGKNITAEKIRSIVRQYGKWSSECMITDQYGNKKPSMLSINRLNGVDSLVPQSILRIEDISERKKAMDLHFDTETSLGQTLFGTIRAISNMLEARDPYTTGHSNTVATISVLIANEMGLSEQAIKEINFAAIVHDIGKISVPISILTKPTKLTEAEFAIIKEHPRVGYNILQEIPFPWNVPKIVLYHHERFDGSGYPEGLSGYDIPLGARILAVADLIDSVSADRPYRSAPGIDVAYDILMENSGILFDPDVVDAALIIRPKLKY